MKFTKVAPGLSLCTFEAFDSCTAAADDDTKQPTDAEFRKSYRNPPNAIYLMLGNDDAERNCGGVSIAGRK